MKKRSLRIRGHATSVSLEEPFWAELKRMAAEAGLPVAALVETIDARRRAGNLSSALRLAVIADLRRRAGGGGSEPGARA